MKRLQWNKLLCETRQRKAFSAIRTANMDNYITRNAFEADYDRIVGSSSVRRLQDKAQVFPLQENDFTRTRLTHSIEVSAMAGSLGKAVGKQLEQKEENFTSEMTEKLTAMLQTAGLIHDLGNPPFGHYGENVIRDWFYKWFNSNELLEKTAVLTEQEKMDFTNFDGNVQNLRIVTKLQTLNDVYGANFTYGTLATIIKYPWKSDDTGANHKGKFGYFKSEEKVYNDIINEIGLEVGKRHPATYLLEAADDIIYICDDIEDGVKKGYIEWNIEFEQLEKNFTDAEHQILFKKIKDKMPDKNMEDDDRKIAIVRNFRNAVQTYLFQSAIKEFVDNYELIMSGEYGARDLLQNEQEFVKELKNITKRCCFSCHEVLALELVGDRVIRTLLDIFINTLVLSEQDELEKVSTYAGKIYSLISSNFKYIALHDYNADSTMEISDLNIYDKIHLCVDYISGMTDSYAVNLYKELTGINIPYLNS